MDTLETAKQTKTAYFIEYVYPIDAYGKQSFYFQLVRTKDYFQTQKGEAMKTCYYLEELHKEILLEEEDIQAVPESGRADEACDAIAAKDYIVRQFQSDTFDSLRQAVCRLCDSPRIRSRHEALTYIVWMAALDIKERRALRHSEAEVKITREEGFVWLIVPREKVRGLWETGTFALYRLYADDSEAEIENKEQLEETLERGYSVGIEVGFVATMGYAARMQR